MRIGPVRAEVGLSWRGGEEQRGGGFGVAAPSDGVVGGDVDAGEQRQDPVVTEPFPGPGGQGGVLGEEQVGVAGDGPVEVAAGAQEHHHRDPGRPKGGGGPHQCRGGFGEPQRRFDEEQIGPGFGLVVDRVGVEGDGGGNVGEGAVRAPVQDPQMRIGQGGGAEPPGDEFELRQDLFGGDRGRWRWRLLGLDRSPEPFRERHDLAGMGRLGQRDPDLDTPPRLERLALIVGGRQRVLGVGEPVSDLAETMIRFGTVPGTLIGPIQRPIGRGQALVLEPQLVAEEHDLLLAAGRHRQLLIDGTQLGFELLDPPRTGPGVATCLVAFLPSLLELSPHLGPLEAQRLGTVLDLRQAPLRQRQQRNQIRHPVGLISRFVPFRHRQPDVVEPPQRERHQRRIHIIKPGSEPTDQIRRKQRLLVIQIGIQPHRGRDHQPAPRPQHPRHRLQQPLRLNQMLHHLSQDHRIERPISNVIQPAIGQPELQPLLDRLRFPLPLRHRIRKRPRLHLRPHHIEPLTSQQNRHDPLRTPHLQHLLPNHLRTHPMHPLPLMQMRIPRPKRPVIHLIHPIPTRHPNHPQPWPEGGTRRAGAGREAGSEALHRHMI